MLRGGNGTPGMDETYHTAEQRPDAIQAAPDEPHAQRNMHTCFVEKRDS